VASEDNVRIVEIPQRRQKVFIAVKKIVSPRANVLASCLIYARALLEYM